MSVTFDPVANLNDISARRQASKVPGGRMRSELYRCTVEAFAMGVPCDYLPYLDQCLVMVGCDQFAADANDAIAKGWRYKHQDAAMLAKYIKVPSADVDDFRAAISAALSSEDEYQNEIRTCLLAAFPAN